jgi:phosphomevalonate kinase
MTEIVAASSPGKIVLSGEYAVLDGAPATCMAVDRRARVTIARHDEPFHRVIAPGFSEEEGRFVTESGQIKWLSGGKSYKLLEQIWNEIDACPDAQLSLTLNTREFLDSESGDKFGIGSSAALATALASALCAIMAPDDDAVSVARRAHRKFQGNTGSGVDIASSSLGGLIEFRMNAAEHLQIEWPDGLVFAVLWSKVPSETAEKLHQLTHYTNQASREALKSAAEETASAWRSGSGEKVLQEYGQYIDTLRRFDNDHELGIFEAGHGALTDAAKEKGVVYKPCGAGGGDVGIVLADDPTALASFVASPVAAGFALLDITIDRVGVELCGDGR